MALVLQPAMVMTTAKKRAKKKAKTGWVGVATRFITGSPVWVGGERQRASVG